MPLGRGALLELLHDARPPVQILIVEKARRFFSLPVGLETPVTVELTDLTWPEPISSVACEHPELTAIRKAISQLDLAESTLRPLHYLQALSIWARGKRLFQARHPDQYHV